MGLVRVRKVKVASEEIWHEGGASCATPLRVCVAAAVVENPYAGRYVEDITPFMQALRELGGDLSARVIAELGGRDAVQAYGKGAIVGEDGELEHGAVWHEAGGWALREALGEARAIVPAAKTVATLGARLIIPLGHRQAAYVRSHFGSAEMTIWDGPRRSEIVFGLAAATGGRVHARIGGLTASEIKGEDGLR